MVMSDTDYPGRTARRYVLSYRVEGADRKIMLDPSAFWFGHLRLMTRKEKREAAQVWQTWHAHPQNAKDFPVDNRLFYVPFEQRTYTRERSTKGYKKADLNLVEQSLPSLEWIIQHELHGKQSRKFKSAHSWNRGADEIFYLGHPTLSPYAGTIETVAHVRSDSSARNPEVPAYRIVTITDLFGTPGHFITNATSVAEGFAWDATKEGRTEIVVVDKHAAAVMELAKYNPSAFRNYHPSYGTAFLPFDFRTSFKHEGVAFREPEHFPGIAPDRRVLLTDLLMYYLFHGQNGGTAFDMSKKLMQMNFLMDSSVVAAIREERMRFEVVTHGHAKPEIEESKVRLLRRVYTDINNDLIHKGYALDGYTLEFGGSDWETVAFNYVGHGEESARVLFHPTYAVPPVIIYKKTRANGNGTEVISHDKSPLAFLAKMPHVSVDDWTRRKVDTVIEVPNAFIADELKQDYRTAIAAAYEGGIAQFRNNVTARYMYGNAAQKEMGRKMLWLVNGS
ncbi:hypothetical protein HZA99_01675 [Candidatus Woesearchaeota archaeon]|nr:hypothetical protein [Candidatus Woesearchaeota archaeon]